jgi:hypothetical protein
MERDMSDEATQTGGPAGAGDPAGPAGSDGTMDPKADEALEGEIVDEGHDGGSWHTAAGQDAGDAYGPGRAGVTFTSSVSSSQAEAHGHGGSGALAFGAVLIAVGAVVLAGRFNHVVAAGGPALWLGAGFLVWWLFSGNYGLLVPAGVLGGLGAGLMLGEAGFYGNAAALGLGAGFVAIFLLDTLRHRRRSNWWPLVPGAVLIALGLLQNTTGWGRLGDLGWPLFLIVAGVVVVGVALADRGRR